MDTDTFKATLARDGYDDIEERAMAPGVFNDRHTHDFDVRALMIEGELTLAWNDHTQTFRAGEVFVMDAGCPHVEQFGSEGARYLVGRRHASI